jgi:hypothetical protein
MGLARPEEMALAPLPQGHQRGSEGFASLRQNIFPISAAIGGRHNFQNSIGDEFAQTRAQDIPGKSQASLKVCKSRRACKGIPKNQERPPLSD